jgi:glutamate mutase epsilon subunit
MTKSLQDAIARRQQIPDDRQDVLARLLIQEIDEDEKWLASTAANAEKLDGRVNDVLAADNRGECDLLNDCL